MYQQDFKFLEMLLDTLILKAATWYLKMILIVDLKDLES